MPFCFAVIIMGPSKKKKRSAGRCSVENIEITARRKTSNAAVSGSATSPQGGPASYCADFPVAEHSFPSFLQSSESPVPPEHRISMTGQVERQIRAKKLLRDGQKILVAVSGGVDSMVLLALLHELAKSHDWKLVVAHFNHQLRGAAAVADEHLVRERAKSLGWPVVVGRGDVAGFARRGGFSMEMAARELRHAFLARTAARRGIPSVALAHHADDQVELFFVRLLRGAGNEGLAGMKWSNPSPANAKITLVRPLLDQAKVDLQAFAQARGLAFREDASNASLEIQRNRIRLELLPLLRAHYQPQLARTVLRCMELAQAEASFVGEAAERWLGQKRKKPFARLPEPVQRRVVQLQLFQLKLPLDFELIEHLRLHPNQPVTTSPGRGVARSDDGRVSLRRLRKETFRTDSLQLNLRRRRSVDFGAVKVSWKIADEVGMTWTRHPNVEQFDADKVGAEVCLRHWQPGDRFRPIGAAAASKLQDIFTNLKVPPHERRRRVVGVTAQGRLFWVEGLRMAEDFKLDRTTTRRLKWVWERDFDRDKSRLQL
jgi:tRNA(Ile)-lysidine synthase